MSFNDDVRANALHASLDSVLSGHQLKGVLGDGLMLCTCGGADETIQAHQLEVMFDRGRYRGLLDAVGCMNEQWPTTDADRAQESGYGAAVEVVRDAADELEADLR